MKSKIFRKVSNVRADFMFRNITQLQTSEFPIEPIEMIFFFFCIFIIFIDTSFLLHTNLIELYIRNILVT